MAWLSTRSCCWRNSWGICRWSSILHQRKGMQLCTGSLALCAFMGSSSVATCLRRHVEASAAPPSQHVWRKPRPLKLVFLIVSRMIKANFAILLGWKIPRMRPTASKMERQPLLRTSQQQAKNPASDRAWAPRKGALLGPGRRWLTFSMPPHLHLRVFLSWRVFQKESSQNGLLTSIALWKIGHCRGMSRRHSLSSHRTLPKA
mmetsp:Transcript_39445/g.62577  ORF Transcript_39445/g.62577 Transcript_39445/m.62577 type:complete len:203 (+) Transcript_39445:1233-1841(+)